MPNFRTTIVATVALVAALGAHGLGQVSQQTPQAAFRSRITMVPLDVRVLDRDGRPVTDLRQEDFTITEDGVSQAIRHFSTLSLTAETPATEAQPALRRVTATPADLAPQNRRVFLLVLGRGRMKGPSKELPALLDFLRTRLLPQDQVAVLAFNRATDFTTNHESLARFVDGYRDRHEKIEQMLAEYFSGLRAVYGSKTIPKNIQTEIDALFSGTSALRPREITPGQITDATQMREDVRRTTDDLQRAELLATRTGEFAGLPDPGATATAERMDVSFDEYVATQIELNQDLNNLYAGSNYLRYLDGEKHLIFLTPKGVSLPRLENNRNLAATASDARVALDNIYVGGAPAAPAPRFSGTGSRIIMPALPSAAAVFGQTFTVSDLRLMSELTGGQTTAFRSGDYAFSHLDQSTRFQYLLGYAPSNPTTNGAFRHIRVRVNRPGVTVLYRQGYFATPQLVPLDRREFITVNRLIAAGRYDKPIEDIKVTMATPTLSGQGSARELRVEGLLQSSKIKFQPAPDGLFTASLDVGIYAGDAKELVVGEVLKKVELKLKEETYKKFLEQGASFNVRIPLKGDPKYVKAIVYDYASDLLGSAVVKIK